MGDAIGSCGAGAGVEVGSGAGGAGHGSFVPCGWVRVDDGESGALLLRRADGRQYAKQVSADRVADLVGERDRLHWATANGIPGPAVVHWADAAEQGEAPTLIMSAVPGVTADRVEPDQVEQAWVNIVSAVRELHRVPTEACPFDRGLRRMFSLARDVVTRGAVHADFLRPEQQDQDPSQLLTDLAAELPVRLEQESGDLVVCHGDLCLPNIVLDADSLEVVGFIDLGRLGVADRHADLSLLLANAQDTWPDHAGMLEEGLAPGYGRALDPERLRFHLLLDPLTWG